MFDNLRPVSLSDRAAEEVRKIMETKNIPADYGLRVGIKGGGCGGVALLIGFDKQKDTDLAYTIAGIPVYVDKKHTMYIIGKEVDFYDGDDARGFTFVDLPAETEPKADIQSSPQPA
jgi:iron-sulfur cluster assembly protein